MVPTEFRRNAVASDRSLMVTAADADADVTPAAAVSFSCAGECNSYNASHATLDVMLLRTWISVDCCDLNSYTQSDLLYYIIFYIFMQASIDSTALYSLLYIYTYIYPGSWMS